MPPSYLDTLNPEQRRAACHGSELEGGGGPLLVIAGAGTGKTSTLAHRVAHLIMEGADPNRILLLTFSRRAAAEMTRRAERILARVTGAEGRNLLAWAGTFHAIGARLLREHAGAIGLSPDFTIHDRADSADLMNIVRHERGLSTTEARFPAKGTCLAIYSRAVNAEAPLEDVLKHAFPWCAMWAEELKGLFAAYVEAKQAQGVLDYDDLLAYWAAMLADAGMAAEIGGRFSHVLVDEYQDTNRLQAAILMALKPDGRGLTVVGDDAQAIYSFRAATVRNILDFPGRFTPPASIVTLEQNYRSTPEILAAANGVIALGGERFAKTLRSERPPAGRPQLVTVRDEADQVRYIVEDVLEARETGMALKAQAVLFRTSSHSAALEIELTRRNIPFVKYGGLKFLDAAHVKDVLTVLRWAENPRDRVAGFRVLLLVPGIGPATAGRVMDEMEAAPAPLAALGAIEPPARAAPAWPPLVALMGELAHRQAGWPGEIAGVRSWYQPLMETAYDDAVVRETDLHQLEQIAAGYPSRQRFLTELTLDPPEASSDRSGVPGRDEDYLILSTIHSAKGQEWRNVHVLNVIDGCIPSDLGTGSSEDIEEERRLLYVAMTRARDRLHLIVPQKFYVTQQGRGGDRHLYANRTRFIPKALLGLFDDRLWPALQPLAERLAAQPQRLDLTAQMRAMWR